MEYKFSFTCDYELVGYFMDIVGLNADISEMHDKEEFHNIQLIDFEICDDYLKYLKDSKSNLGGSCVIHVLDNEGISIGEYSVCMKKL